MSNVELSNNSGWDSDEPIVEKKRYNISYNTNETDLYEHHKIRLPLFSYSHKQKEKKEIIDFNFFIEKYRKEIDSLFNDLLNAFQNENINFSNLELVEIKNQYYNYLFDLYSSNLL